MLKPIHTFDLPILFLASAILAISTLLILSIEPGYFLLVHYLHGFLYSMVLWLCLNTAISIYNGVAFVIGLGLLNAMLMYSALPLLLVLESLPFPSFSGSVISFITILWSGFLGAILTFFLLKYLWRLALNWKNLITTLTCIGISYLVFTMFKVLVEFNPVLDGPINGAFWMVGFTFALFLIESSKDKNDLIKR